MNDYFELSVSLKLMIFLSASGVLVGLSLAFHPCLFQVVKDRICLRALEKMMHQLVDSKEQAELLSASALQPLDVNADGQQL